MLITDCLVLIADCSLGNHVAMARDPGDVPRSLRTRAGKRRRYHLSAIVAELCVRCADESVLAAGRAPCAVIPTDQVGQSAVTGYAHARAEGMRAGCGKRISHDRVLAAIDDLNGGVAGRASRAADESIR